MAKQKKFKEFAQLKPAEFHKSKKKRLPELKTVDFRSRGRTTLIEQILGTTKDFPLDPYNHKSPHTIDNENFEKRLELHYNDHNENHNKAIRKYTKSMDDISPNSPEKNDYHSSEAVNGHLRSSKIEKDQEPHAYKPQVHFLDQATSSHEAPEDFHVYVGLHEKPKPGEIHKHHGYISSSVEPAIAKTYAKESPHASGSADSGDHEHVDKHMLKLKIPKGSKHGYYIGNRKHLSEYEHEKEFLIGRGKKIHIHHEPEIRTHVHTSKNYYGDENKKTYHHHIWHGKIVDE
jgi:hypothetical protein